MADKGTGSGTDTAAISPLASASHHRLEAAIPEDREVTLRSGGDAEYNQSAGTEEPFPTRRTRRPSVNKGHGFVEPDSGGDPLFIHISDIDGEWVPVEGDKVTYKLCPMPPKMEKFQAAHVRIVNLAPGAKHEHWNSP